MAIDRKIILPAPDHPSQAGRGRTQTLSSTTSQPSNRASSAAPSSAVTDADGTETDLTSDLSTSNHSSERSPLLTASRGAPSTSAASSSSRPAPGLSPPTSYGATSQDAYDEHRNVQAEADTEAYEGEEIPPPPYSDSHAYWVRRPFRRTRSKWVIRSLKVSIFTLSLVFSTAAVVLWLIERGYFRTYPWPQLPPDSTKRHFADWSSPEKFMPGVNPRFKYGLYTSQAVFELPPNTTTLTFKTDGSALDATMLVDTKHDIETPSLHLTAAFSSIKLRDAVAAFASYNDSQSSSVGITFMTSDELELWSGDSLAVSAQLYLPPSDALRIQNITTNQHSGALIFNVHPDSLFSHINITSPILNLDVRSSLRASHSIEVHSWVADFGIRGEVSAPRVNISVPTMSLHGGTIAATDALAIRSARCRIALEHIRAPYIDVQAAGLQMAGGTMRIEGGGLNVDTELGDVSVEVEVAPVRAGTASVDLSASATRGESSSSPTAQSGSRPPGMPTWLPYPAPKPPLPPWMPWRSDHSVNVSISNRYGLTAVSFTRPSDQQQRQMDAPDGAGGSSSSNRSLPPSLNSTIATQNGTISVQHDASFLGGFLLYSERAGSAGLHGPEDHGSSSHRAAEAASGGGGGGIIQPQPRRVMEVVKDRSSGSRVWIQGVVREVGDENEDVSTWPPRSPGFPVPTRMDRSEVRSDTGQIDLNFH